jgi:hypothetical protein
LDDGFHGACSVGGVGQGRHVKDDAKCDDAEA